MDSFTESGFKMEKKLFLISLTASSYNCLKAKIVRILNSNKLPILNNMN